MAFLPFAPLVPSPSSSLPHSAFLATHHRPHHSPNTSARSPAPHAVLDLNRPRSKHPKPSAPARLRPTPSIPARKTHPRASPPPGETDARYFTEAPSVSFWRYHKPVNRSTLPSRLSNLLQSATGVLSAGPSPAAYWTHAILRNAFFSTVTAGGLVLVGLSGALTPRQLRDNIAARGLPLVEDAAHVLAQDEARVRAGVYRRPWDADVRHRQNDPSHLLSKSGKLIEEFWGILKRKGSASKEVAVWMEGRMYPEYYMQKYHYQTDGWMSSSSADVYEFLTDALFLGLQDAMQRLTLVALSDFLGPPGAKPRRRTRAPHVVEIAAGTGRFATFVRDNWPELDYVVSDLSPFYLEKARENMQYWEHTAGRRRKLGNVRYVQANAEELPIDDASVDVVFSVYLFHELPPSARRAVIAEAARVLRPGGLFVITDSLQHGDRPSTDATLNDFEHLNEPWYGSYLQEDFGALAESEGWFKPSNKELSLATKMLSFVRTQS